MLFCSAFLFQTTEPRRGGGGGLGACYGKLRDQLRVQRYNETNWARYIV